MAIDREPLISQCPGKGFVLYLVPVGFISFLLRRVKHSDMAAVVMFEALRSNVGPVHGQVAKNLETERL